MGARIQPKKISVNIAINSNCPTAKPRVDPEPANPIKCSLEIFVAKIEMPTVNQPIFLPAKNNLNNFHHCGGNNKNPDLIQLLSMQLRQVNLFG